VNRGLAAALLLATSLMATPELPARWQPLRPHVVQSQLWHSTARFRVVPAGRRSGKTELAKRRLVLCGLAGGRYFPTTLSRITDAGTLAAQNANAVSLTGGSAALSGALTTTAGGIGYATGAGGTVSQTSNKSTSVTLDKLTGKITTSSAALAGDTTVSFTLNNSTVTAEDHIVADHFSGGTLGSYVITGRATGAGTASITIRNVTGGSLSEALVIKFTVIKGTAS
jgi:hypothetical protein